MTATVKCLAILCLPITLPQARPIASASRSVPVDDGAQQLGGGQQVLALAGALGGQHRVAAGDQPLAGKVRRGHLGRVLLIEEAELQRAVVGHQLADRRDARRGDPPVVLIQVLERRCGRR